MQQRPPTCQCWLRGNHHTQTAAATACRAVRSTNALRMTQKQEVWEACQICAAKKGAIMNLIFALMSFPPCTPPQSRSPAKVVCLSASFRREEGSCSQRYSCSINNLYPVVCQSVFYCNQSVLCPAVLSNFLLNLRELVSGSGAI